jgi:hypothetical protein
MADKSNHPRGTPDAVFDERSHSAGRWFSFKNARTRSRISFAEVQPTAGFRTNGSDTSTIETVLSAV